MVIAIDVYLINNGFQNNITSKAYCNLLEDIDGRKKPGQAEFSCYIYNVPETVESFIYKSSANVVGIPNDKGLLNPVITDQRIARGEIYDAYYTYILIGNLPTFTPKSLENNKCEETGVFTIIGDISKKLKNSIRFELPLESTEKITVNCLINETNKTENVTIYCETNKEFAQPIKISQKIIWIEKIESLIIKKFEMKNNIKCANYKRKILEQKINNEYFITFRQICNFRKKKNKFSFFLAGLTDKNLPQNHKITMNVYIITNYYIGIGKIEKEIDCVLLSQMNQVDGEYTQADFSCTGDAEDNIDDIEIISSPSITGMELLKDFQKSPKKTDEKINETRNYFDHNIGKVMNYSEQYQKEKNVPVFEILSINNKNCEEKGRILIKGNFSKNIDEKFDFIIPLSYPSSLIKCTAPKIEAKTPVYLYCKVQKEFDIKKNESLIFEPTLIMKKNREILFLKKYSQSGNDLNDFTCSDYNQKQLIISKQKYNSNYTFLQTNNFRKISGKTLFDLFLFSSSNYSDQIPINITIIEKPKALRNLEDSVEENNYEVKCKFIIKSNHTEELEYYICESEEIEINDEKDIEHFIIESNDISGLTDDNTNPIKTDEGIKENKFNKVFNLSEPDVFNSISISILNSTNITENDCERTGSFIIEGSIEEKDASNNTEDFNINYIIPSDSGALCYYDNSLLDTEGIECYNKEEFFDEKLTIDNQFINGNILLNKIQLEKYMTCAVSSRSFTLPYDNANNSINTEESPNKFLNVKYSSGGLSRAAIVTIIIVSTLVIVGVIVLIIVSKKLKDNKKKSIALNNNTIYSNEQNISKSSTNII